MCYPKPGPRCSKHAYQKMLKKSKQFEKLQHTRVEEECADRVKEEYNLAIKDYLQTPQGIALLKTRFGDEHSVPAKYEQARESQMEALRKVNPKYAQKSRQDKIARGSEEQFTQDNPLPIAYEVSNDSRLVSDKEHTRKWKEKDKREREWYSYTPEMIHPRTAVCGKDMREVYENSDQMRDMSMGDTLYVNHEGDITKEPGSHSPRSRITLVSQAGSLKVVKIEYDSSYYARATTDPDLKEGRKKSYSTLKSAKEISDRISYGDSSEIVMINGSPDDSEFSKIHSYTEEGYEALPIADGGYLHEFSPNPEHRDMYDNKQAFDVLHAKQEAIISTNKKLKMLEQKKTEFVEKYKNGERTPDAETMRLFNTRIEEGYTKLGNQITLFNHSNKIYKEQEDALFREKRQMEISLEMEKEREKELQTFHELKSMSFS